MSDKTRELAKELADDLHDWLLDRTSIEDDKRGVFHAYAAIEAKALLDAFERTTRLDEAKWWHTQVAIVAVAGGDDGHEVRDETRQRIAALAQPTPEVKK